MNYFYAKLTITKVKNSLYNDEQQYIIIFVLNNNKVQVKIPWTNTNNTNSVFKLNYLNLKKFLINLIFQKTFISKRQISKK